MGLVQSLKNRGSSVAFIPLLLMGKGLTPQKLVTLAIQRVYRNLGDYDNLEDFHSSVLSIFEIANSAFPGKHFEAPSRGQVEEVFEKWKMSDDEEERKKTFTKLLEDTKLGTIDNFTLIVGLVTPPFSMVAKRAGENVTPFKMIKNVPDALLVPTVTVLTLFSLKLIRKAAEKYSEEADYKEKRHRRNKKKREEKEDEAKARK
ncbi:hypothetical protein PVL29_019788 [Vitis rotundifolia]|uniref:Calcium ion-binding protein n=1 Tax=Vitis rotundifolia TaxID=103349 RepID=A0AA38Z1W1_VITRO|nr:hypothetical protein PVL29_019788 [Vitis rotundifolia]